MQALLSQLSDAVQLCLVPVEPTPEKREEFSQKINEMQEKCNMWNEELVKLKTTPALYDMWQELTQRIQECERLRLLGFAEIRGWEFELKPRELSDQEKWKILRPIFVLLNYLLIENYHAERDKILQRYIDLANEDLSKIDGQHCKMCSLEFRMGELLAELDILKEKDARYSEIRAKEVEIEEQRKMIHTFDINPFFKKKELIDKMIELFDEFATTKDYFSVIPLEQMVSRCEKSGECDAPTYIHEFIEQFNDLAKVDIFKKCYKMERQEYFNAIRSVVNGVVDFRFNFRGFIMVDQATFTFN